MLWVYYSSIILLFGASFIEVYTRKQNRIIGPSTADICVQSTNNKDVCEEDQSKPLTEKESVRIEILRKVAKLSGNTDCVVSVSSLLII